MFEKPAVAMLKPLSYLAVFVSLRDSQLIAQALSLKCTSKQSKCIYGNGLNIVIRGVASPLQVEGSISPVDQYTNKLHGSIS